MHKNYVKYTYFTKRYVPEYTTKHIFQEYIIKYFSIFFINTNGKIMLNRTLSQIAWPFYGKTPLAKWTWFFISILLCCSQKRYDKTFIDIFMVNTMLYLPSKYIYWTTYSSGWCSIYCDINPALHALWILLIQRIVILA